MGFDVYGVAPEVKEGDYFRNNVWYWRPLWNFVAESCPDVITERDREAGHVNDGHLISGKKAKLIAKRLNEMLANGEVAQYQKMHNAKRDAMKDVPCEHCKGTGKRDDQYVKGTCNACIGKGMVRPFDSYYPFEESNVREFAKFANASGGFKIW